jgi:Putative Flp pilus-assembly TadE/G-like
MRCRRGTVALTFAVVMIPLIGMASLGTEAGMWYATKRHAQNAADTAAYSGALRLAKPETGVGAQTIAYRGKQFAAQNGFCNPGDTAYPGTSCTGATAAYQGVTINSPPATGPYAGNVNAVQAIVTQAQRPLLSSLFLSGNDIIIDAQAVALIKQPANPCILALSSITVQGSPTISLPGCGMGANSTASDAIKFTGNGGVSITGPILVQGGCSGNAALCAPVSTNALPIVNPLAGLPSTTDALTSLSGLPKCAGSKPVAYTGATPCRNDKISSWPATPPGLAGGTYVFSGTMTLSGGDSLTGASVTIILLPGASISMKGNASVNITGQATVPTTSLPPLLQPYASLLANVALYDPNSGAGWDQGGSSTFQFGGAMYLPNADVTFKGNPEISTCSELIAASVSFIGNASFSNTGCPASLRPSTQAVQLVQ